jgi:succinate-acetate transporter protein
MIISAQWEIVRGDSFGFTTLMAFGEPSQPLILFFPSTSHDFHFR